MRRFVLCLALLLACAQMRGQQDVLLFESRIIDAGTVAEDSGIHNYIFEFQNVSSDTLTITKVSSNCHCTTAKCNLRSIAPSQKAKIAVNYDPKGHSGSFERKIFIYSSRIEEPEAVLRLKIKVEDRSGLPYRLVVFALESKQVDLGQDKRSAELSLKNLSQSKAGLRLECSFLPEGLEASIDKTDFAPLETGLITVKCAGNVKNGDYPIYLETDKGQQTKLTIKIRQIQ